MSEPSSWILDDLPVGVWVGRVPTGEVEYANNAFHEIMGMAAVSGSRVDDVPATYGVRDREGRPFPIERLPISQVMAKGVAVVVDDIVIHRFDGSKVNVRATGHPVHDAGGRLTHVIVAFIDNTREVQAEAERATVEARLRHTVEHAPIILYGMDRAGVVTLSEGAGLNAIGVRPGELVGRSVFDLYKDDPVICAQVRQALAGEVVFAANRIGDAVLETRMTPLRDPRGEVTGVLGVSHDRSELSRLEAAAIQNDRVMAMGALAASVAHEINNPLTYVLTHLDSAAEALARQLEAAGRIEAPNADLAAVLRAATDAYEDLLPVRKGFARIAAITRDLRAFSRPDDTRSEPVDLRGAVESVLKLLQKHLEARARLVLRLEQTPPVMGNEARVVQVIMNLLMNAAQSLAHGQTEHDQIIATTRAEAGLAILEIADTGRGVPVEEREHIFEPFVTTKPVGEGTGLGLFVCRNIVRGLGGRIEVLDRPGGGALFRVSLPAAVAAAPAPRAPDPERAQLGQGARVLVIDDDAMVARALAGRLRSAGFLPSVTTDAREALLRLDAGEVFDLIFCDLMMPGMTGMDFAAALAPERLLRVVFMTGGAFTAEAAAFVAARSEVCVEKPFNVVAETRRRLRA